MLKKLERTGPARQSPAELDSVRQFVRKKLGQGFLGRARVQSDMTKAMDLEFRQDPVYKPPASGGAACPEPRRQRGSTGPGRLHGRQKRLKWSFRGRTRSQAAVTKSRLIPLARPWKAPMSLNSQDAENADRVNFAASSPQTNWHQGLEQGNWLRNLGGRAEHLVIQRRVAVGQRAACQGDRRRFRRRAGRCRDRPPRWTGLHGARA